MELQFCLSVFQTGPNLRASV